MLTVAFFDALGREWWMRSGRSLVGRNISAKKLKLTHYPMVAFLAFLANILFQIQTRSDSQDTSERSTLTRDHSSGSCNRTVHLMYAKIRQPILYRFFKNFLTFITSRETL